MGFLPSACKDEPCSAPTTITLANAVKGHVVTLEKGFTEVGFTSALEILTAVASGVIASISKIIQFRLTETV